MKAKHLLLSIVCVVLFANIAQGSDYWDWLHQQFSPKTWEDRFQEWWAGVWEDYMAAKRAWELGFIQDWNENMQDGIRRLNLHPQQHGVTSVNGALLFTEADFSLPGRHGHGVSIVRYYNSKIWFADTSNDARNDSLSLAWHVGQGWDMHFGRLWSPVGDKTYETSSGIRILFKNSVSGDYLVATDGSFMRLIDSENTILTGDGTQLVFGHYDDSHNTGSRYLTKIIDPNGNLTEFFYVSGSSLLDSIKTSAGAKCWFHYDQYWPRSPYEVIDSISYTGYNSETLTVVYKYDTVSTSSSPFGAHEDSTYILTSVVYPNGDSVYYDYNQYFELNGVHTVHGGTINYSYQTDTFFIPHTEAFPPEPNARPLLQITRGITKIKRTDHWTEADSILYQRYRTYQGVLGYAKSNADSVVILDAEGNYQYMQYQASYAPVTDEDVFQWNWDNGKLLKNEQYDKNNTLLGWSKSEMKLITDDSIPVIKWSKSNNGVRTYETRYREYDTFGNAKLVCAAGDTSITSDDRWIHRQYLRNDPQYCSFWLHESAHGFSTYDGDAITEFYSQAGVDTLIIKRRWIRSPNPDSLFVDTICYSTPAIHDSRVDSLKSNSEDTLAAVIVEAREYSTPAVCKCSVTVYIGPELPAGGQRDDVDADSINSYQYTHLYHLVSEEYINNDSASTSWWQKTTYSYDDTNHVVRTYDPPFHQDPIGDPPDTSDGVNLRGNLTKVERWENDNDCTKTEFRYDEVGNVVMSITHPTTSTAETTFAYFDPTSDADKYNYAYPWRVVNHLSTSIGSLYVQTEYDLYTGLDTTTYNFNGDSTRCKYDKMNRLIEVWSPNEQYSSKRVTYSRYQSSTQPAAVLDSIKQESDLWIVNKVFYDGFGRTIQTKSFDYDNNRTVVVNTAYGSNGLVDSVCSPYRISGTSQDYSSPTWSQLATYHYDGLGRDTLIVHPDGEKIRMQHNGNIDTVFDEKGNKAIYKYNAFGGIDTVIDAYGDKTSYKYDILGRLTKARDAESKDTKYYYDKLSRLVAMNGPDAKSSYKYPEPDGDSVDVLYEYDDVGNLTRKKDANGWVDYEYDDLYRLVEIRHSANQGSTWPDTIRFVYDVAASSPTPETLYVNPKGRLGKLITVGTDSVSYYYDNRGNMTMKQVSINGLQGTKCIKYKYNKAAQCTTLWATGVGYVAKYGYNSLGQLKNMPSFVSSFKYNPAGQIVKINLANPIRDTIAYDSRFRPILVNAYDPRPQGGDILKLRYAYQKNSNVDSIIDKLVSGNTQAFTYDSLNRLTTVTMAADTQTFAYDKVGNRTSKDGTSYTYYQNTNRLSEDHRNYTYDYDDNGNIIRHQLNSSTVDSFAYDWNNRPVYYKKGNETIDYAYNASGLRVKKHYRKKSEQAVGSGLQEASLDLGMVELGADSIYNKGRDMITVYSKDTSTYVNFRIVNQYLYDDTTTLNLYITLDIDTIENSGILTYPEDSMTRVPPEAAWEYCAYVEGDDYGLYDQKGTKDSQPFSMIVEKVPGDSGEIRIKIAKSLIGGPSVVRYTIATFDPDTINTDTQWQGGSSVCDVFPGTIETFGGTVNGYGEFSSTTLTKITEYTIYYVYDGINPIVEYSPSGSKLKHYVYAGSRHIARVAGADTHWYHVDALGSPRKMTDESGTVVWSATYLPFGEMTESGTDDNSHGFTGKELDENSLNYFCQRYYDPEIGRFMTLDPQDSPTASPYAYCANNPLILVDPTGEAIRAIEYDEMYWFMGDHAASKEGWFGGYTGAEPGFGSWPGSMRSYMHAHPEFYARVLYNELISGMRFFFAKNDYFRTTTENLGERVTTEYFFNPITGGVGNITTIEQLGSEDLALTLLELTTLTSSVQATDAGYDYGEWVTLNTEFSKTWNSLEAGLIPDEIFWTVVTLGLKGAISGEFPVAFEYKGFHQEPHRFFGKAMSHYQWQLYLRHIPGAGITIRLPIP